MSTTPVPGRPAADPFAGIDADLELLDTLEPAGQVAVFDTIHAALTAALAATAGANEGPALGSGR